MNASITDISEIAGNLSQIANAYRQSILLLKANRLGLFSRLADKTLPARQIAAELGWDSRAAELFLNALTAMGLLVKENEKYSNSSLSKELLIKDSPNYQGDILNHDLHLWERWSNVDEVLISGKPARDPVRRRSEDELRAFIGGMANIARFSASLLWEKINLAAHKRLLDLGGGPGTYAFVTCQLNPELEAVVFDLPEVKPIFEEHRGKSGVGNRVKFHAGDFQEDIIPSGFDVVLLSSIIHSYGPLENQELIAKLAKAVMPGGLVLIKDFYISEDGTEPLFAALFAVNMLLGTEAGRCYRQEEVRAWLENAGLKPKDFLEITEQTGVIVAEK